MSKPTVYIAVLEDKVIRASTDPFNIAEDNTIWLDRQFGGQRKVTVYKIESTQKTEASYVTVVEYVVKTVAEQG